MDLPIDYQKAPYRAKYLDEETRALTIWFIFGESPDGKTVDIADPFGDVMLHVPRDKAELLIEARREFVGTVLSVFSDFSKA